MPIDGRYQMKSIMKRFLKYVYHIYISRTFGSFDKSSWISPFGTYLCKKQIFIGSNVYIGKGAFLSANTGLTIGNGVTVGPEWMVMGGDHKFNEVGKRIFQMTTGRTNLPVIIEDDVWIGARVTILKGVRVGEGAIVGAGAVVTKDIPPYMIYAGNPAKKIGLRYRPAELQRHLALVQSRYVFDEISHLYE